MERGAAPNGLGDRYPMGDGHYLVLARKWRPAAFEEVIGQEHITRTLQNAIRAGRVGHAFLFVGSRGIGKTTSARILAKALNCLAADAPTPTPCGKCDNCTTIAAGTNIDVIEIDGASNNSVDDVRQIRENIRMVPASSRFKIYVIDEVHQLSTPAFNALLKTLEEPPPHAVFVLATTEARKIPATIISRCQRYDFRRVGQPQIVELLKKILDSEGIPYTEEALYAIARAADGGVRDAESILDQLVSYCDGEITFQDVFDVLGLVNWQSLHDLCDAIQEKDVGKMLQIVEDVVLSGKDLSQFAQEILRYYRNLLVCKSGASANLLAMPEDEVAEMNERAGHFGLTELIRIVEQFSELTGDFDSQLAHRTAVEALLIKMSRRTVEVSVDTVLDKLMQLGGEEAAPQPAVAPTTAPRKPAGPAAVSPEAAAPPGAPDSGAAPPTSAPSKKEVAPVDAADLDIESLWARVVEEASRENFNLATWLPHARPQRVENGTLILELDAEQQTARNFLEKPEVRATVEAVLTKLAPKLSGYQTTATKNESGQTSDSAQPDLPLFETVDPEDGRAALSDPAVSEVIDVFKGQIVDIKKSSESTSDS